ncbi:MAG: hypothetical protein ACFE85_10010 [Candidatus Hodarchaeota archaeon]
MDSKYEQIANEIKELKKIIDNKNKEISSRIDKEINDINRKLKNELELVNSKLENILQRITDTLDKEIMGIKSNQTLNQEQLEEMIKTQEDIIVDMVKKLDDEFSKHKTGILNDIESVKSQQDVLKISYTINEKKLMQQVKELVSKEFSNRLQGQEAEILLKTWIDEFKEIIEDFEKLKILKPKEFSLKIAEISNTIDLFKQKLQIER